MDGSQHKSLYRVRSWSPFHDFDVAINATDLEYAIGLCKALQVQNTAGETDVFWIEAVAERRNEQAA